MYEYVYTLKEHAVNSLFGTQNNQATEQAKANKQDFQMGGWRPPQQYLT